MQEPKKELINSIEKQMDLFQTTVGKANSNVISMTTIILNNMAQTIVAQFEEIGKKNDEIATINQVLKTAEDEIKKLKGEPKNNIVESLPEPLEK